MTRLSKAMIIFILISAAIPAVCQDDFERMDCVPIREMFEYDRNLPFNVEKTVKRESALTTTYEIYFDSAHNQRVPAVLTVPKTGGPHPVIIFMHGHGMKKDMGEMGDMLLGQKKYAMFGIDVEYRNERKREGHDILSQYVYSSRDAFIQTVIDNMRGIDYLETLDEIDPDRIGMMGLSMGTFIGSVVFSLDKRIRVAAFGVGGANWKKVGEKSFFGPLYQLKSSGRSIEEIFGAFSVVDPLNFAWDTKGRPKIMINGRLDELVPAEAAVALYQGFAEPKHIIWFDGGHVPSMDIIMDLVYEMFDFFNDNLKPKRFHRVPPGEDTAPLIKDLRISPAKVRQNETVDISVRAKDRENNIFFVKAYFDCGNDSALLYDDGKTGGDEEKHDLLYTGRHRIFEKAALGKSTVHVTAVDRWGETSEELTAEIEVLPIQYPEDANPPAITKTVVPEKLRIGDKVHFEVHAEDPDGDLTQILVTVDELGLTLAMPPGADGSITQDFNIPDDLIPTGKYHFTFQAKDATKMYSEKVRLSTEILPREEAGE